MRDVKSGRDSHVKNIEGDVINIKAKGDVIFGKDQAKITLNKIQQSDTPDDLKTKLEELTKAVEDMIQNTPKDKEKEAKKAKKNFDKLVSEATSEEPDKEWYQVSGKGLIEAAEAVGELGVKVVTGTKAVLELLPMIGI